MEQEENQPHPSDDPADAHHSGNTCDCAKHYQYGAKSIKLLSYDCKNYIIQIALSSTESLRRLSELLRPNYRHLDPNRRLGTKHHRPHVAALHC